MPSELMTTDSAIEIATAVEFPELVEALEIAKAANVDFVSITPNDDMTDVAVAPATGVMVAWILPEDSYDVQLAMEGGVTDHHVTLCYLGDAVDMDTDQQRQLIGIVAEVAQRHVGLVGTIGGVGVFDNEDEAVWYAEVQIDQLVELQSDLQTSLLAAGLPVHTDHGPYQPHVTLAYLPAGEIEPTFDVAPFPAVISQLTIAIGGSRFDIPLQDIDWEEQATDGLDPSVRTPYVPIIVNGVVKALGDLDPETMDEWRYTLGPIYMPGVEDAHGDSIDADDLERSIHDYVRTGDRDIRLQHDTSVIAGEWVGLLVWPWPVTVPVWDLDTEQMIQRTFPAGTPFMGVVWEPAVWPLIKSGDIRGYSLGGFAEFMTVDIEGDDELTKQLIERFNPNHDTHGRFGQGAGIAPSESQFGLNPKVDAKIGTTKLISKPTRQDSAIHQAIYDAPKANYTMEFQETKTKRGHTATVVAKLDGQQVGHLDLHDHRDPGKSLEVGFITTNKDFQRQGIATAMLDFARRDASLPVHHSAILTPDGEAFTSVTKFNPNHDAHGRFGSGYGATATSVQTGAGGTISKIDAAAVMYGTGSPQHIAAQRRFGPAEAKAQAAQLHANAAKVEPALTKAMTAVAVSQGNTMAGLDFKLKSQDSLARKIATDAMAQNITPQHAAASISDAVRYTMVAKPANYTSSAMATVQQLRGEGYTLQVKNYWQKGDAYQGLNIAAKSPSGTKFELQIHTQRSFESKNTVVHPLYDKYRSSTDMSTKVKLWNQMTSIADALPVPPDVLGIPDLKMQPGPIG